MEATGEVPLRACMRTRNGIPTDLTRLTLRRSAAVCGSGGDRVKDLTPNVGPHSHRIANQRQSTCRTDARPIARSNDDVDGLGRGLEHLAAVPDPADQLATSLATSTQIVTTAAARRVARSIEASAEPLPITRASRQ